ncbi:uncharacterized protein LOC142576623 isoform X1 [Dermacentor variabilis]|uniref:uncharacterized protein LOC142576623 isoform X1 n=1 Tax=Dermacentor variabilis TaxID=34621 RepID=UPI003F5B3BED
MLYALAFAVSSSGLKWDASPSLVRKCLQNLPGLLRPSRASEKSLRYWREQTEFITCACATHWRRQYELHFSLAGQVGMAMHLGEQDSNCESLVVSQNFVLCQDGLTPCHLMLSLSVLSVSPLASHISTAVSSVLLRGVTDNCSCQVANVTTARELQRTLCTFDAVG